MNKPLFILALPGLFHGQVRDILESRKRQLGIGEISALLKKASTPG